MTNDSSVPSRSTPTPPAIPRSRAGEGGGLPKGLSLFRFILFSSLMLGALYGGVSLSFNTPPPPGDVPPHGVPSAEWSPSPLWLPAFIALQLRIGAAPTPQGYVFSSRAGYAAFAMASVIFGIVLLGLVGWFAGEAIRKWAVRKRYE